ncbi:ABC transporter ATP-binding protein [Bacillus sp. BGMRC 2118]|nr:ABC transporter ATP-binding protein [Bacillus sp. BGMRC 2118]
MKVIEIKGLVKKYGKKTALNQLDFSIEANKITGVIGRNGAGKTTLLKIMAGFMRKTSGEINVFSEDPFDNLKVSANMVFIDDNMSFSPSLTLQEIVKIAEEFYENWDAELAKRLFHYFQFQSNERHQKLSKGKKSTFNAIIGLAARCPLTIFDEPTTGMDAAVRKDFYRALLKEYIEYPRTILLSSHHLTEIEDLLEDVLLIKNGEVSLHTTISDLKEYAIGISGKREIIKDWIESCDVLAEKNLGAGNSYIVVKNSGLDIEKARLQGLEIHHVSAEDVSVYITGTTGREIDDVLNRS